MKLTKEQNNKGITLVSLIITVVLMLVLATSTAYISLDRFEINRYNKMINDIELLTEKVSNYYLKYNVFPFMRNEENEIIEYTYTQLDFETEGKYYILDLNAMDNISLNYGKEGYSNPNISSDAYVINDISNKIYYVQGIELNDVIYHTISDDNNKTEDNIPPTRPQIKLVYGEKDIDDKYFTNIELELVPGIDKISQIEKTTYSINGGIEQDITTLTNNIYNITEDGTYEMKIKSYDNKGNISETIESFTKKTISIVLDKEVIDKEIKNEEITDTLTVTASNIVGELNWESSNTAIVEITGEGNTRTIKCKSPGKATITVSYGKHDSKCEVILTEKIE